MRHPVAASLPLLTLPCRVGRDGAVAGRPIACRAVGKLYVVRHADAGTRGRGDIPDEHRQLSPRGHRQADGLRDTARRRGHRAARRQPVHCVASRRWSLLPSTSVSRSRPTSGCRRAMGFVGALELADELRGGPGVLCSHGDVIPDLLDALLRQRHEAQGRASVAEGVDVGAQSATATGSRRAATSRRLPELIRLVGREGGVDLGAQACGELTDRGRRVEGVEPIELTVRLLDQAVAEEDDREEGVHVGIGRVAGGRVEQDLSPPASSPPKVVQPAPVGERLGVARVVAAAPRRTGAMAASRSPSPARRPASLSFSVTDWRMPPVTTSPASRRPAAWPTSTPASTANATTALTASAAPAPRPPSAAMSRRTADRRRAPAARLRPRAV